MSGSPSKIVSQMTKNQGDFRHVLFLISFTLTLLKNVLCSLKKSVTLIDMKANFLSNCELLNILQEFALFKSGAAIAMEFSPKEDSKTIPSTLTTGKWGLRNCPMRDVTRHFPMEISTPRKMLD